MHTVAEVRRDVSVNQLVNLTNGPAQNRGAGDGVVPGANGIPQASYTAAPHHGNLPHISCRTSPNNSNNFYNNSYNERNGLVRQLWRQQSVTTAPCLHPRPTHSFNGNAQNPAVPVFYNGNPESNRPGAMHVVDPARRFVTAAPIDNLNQAQSPSFVNYSSANVLASANNYPQSGNSSIVPSYLSITQFNYQNLPARNGLPSIGPPPLPPMNYPSIPPPPPLPPVQPPLVFGPPPRDRRSIVNVDEENRLCYQEILPAGPQFTNDPNLTQGSVLQNFCNALKLPLIQTKEFRISNESMGNEQINCDNTYLDSVPPPYVKMDSCQPQSARANIKLKFSKNVVNIPKKIEIKQNGNSESYSSNDSAKSDSNSIVIKSNGTVDVKVNEPVYRSPEETKMFMHELEANDSSFILQEENALIDMMVEGCIHGEEIAIKYQNIPCFKNIKKLCEKTKNDLMTPHCTARNIHSQGIPWATKDYIFAFTRLTSCWYLLKGYLGQKSDIFEKIEQLYSPGLRRSFELWENTTADLAFHIMKSFVALGNNSSSKWNPRAHSTPLHSDYYKKIATIPPMLPINFDESSNPEGYRKNGEVQILTRNNTESDEHLRGQFKTKHSDMYKAHPRMGDYQSHVYKTTPTNYDFDSGDEDSSKKYIKPGCYTVPQVRNASRSNVISPKNRLDIDSIKKSDYQKPSSICITPKNILRNLRDSKDNTVQHVPFKHTPQGILTSALMKQTREDVSNDLLKTDTIKIISHNNPFSGESPNLFSSNSLENIPEYILFSNNVESSKLNVENGDELIADTANGTSDAGTSTSSSGYQNENSEKSNGDKFGTSKRPFSNVETKSVSTTSIRKGIIVTTRRRSEISDMQTKRTSIKKCHKSYYNTILTAPKTSVDDSYLDCKMSNKTKYRQNGDWNVSSTYNRKRDGLSRVSSEAFESILNELWNMPSSQYFTFEVDVRDTPEYYQIVKYPMFLTNILQKLKECKYHSINQVVHDFRRIFRNARLFLETHPDKKLQRLNGHFSNAFEQLLIDRFPRMDFTSTPSKSDNSNASTTQEDR